MDIGLFATNMTKERFHVYTTDGITSYDFDAIILNQPQMYGVRLKYRFGS
ncbi:MAG TPA: hypothetical protein VF463_08065 [Sphingobium sp.]